MQAPPREEEQRRGARGPEDEVGSRQEVRPGAAPAEPALHVWLVTRHDVHNVGGAFVALFAIEEDAQAHAGHLSEAPEPRSATYYVTRQPVR